METQTYFGKQYDRWFDTNVDFLLFEQVRTVLVNAYGAPHKSRSHRMCDLDSWLCLDTDTMTRTGPALAASTTPHCFRTERQPSATHLPHRMFPCLRHYVAKWDMRVDTYVVNDACTIHMHHINVESKGTVVRQVCMLGDDAGAHKLLRRLFDAKVGENY
jgi:hypothetical protein